MDHLHRDGNRGRHLDRDHQAGATTLIGQTLGPYRVLDKLGEGGMGEVYRARHLTLDREVAIKANHPSYGLPNANLGSADFGTIRTTVSTPRQMQFGLKLIF